MMTKDERIAEQKRQMMVDIEFYQSFIQTEENCIEVYQEQKLRHPELSAEWDNLIASSIENILTFRETIERILS